MQRVFDFLQSSDIPPVARSMFVLERTHYIIWALVLGAIEGNLAGIVAAKTFHASSLLASVVWAAPIFMMSINVIWGTIIRGRRRVALLVTLTICAALLVFSIGFTPPNLQPWGGWIFATQIGLTHFFVTGLVTLRSSIWQGNYPESHRGRIIGRLQTIRFLFVPLSGVAVAVLFDADPQYYRFVYPAAAVVALISLLPLRRFRIRGQRREIREYRAHLASTSQDAASHTSIWTGIKEAASILRNHHEYRRYMMAQFSLGSANFFTDPVVLVVVTAKLGFDYLPSTLIMAGIPGVCSWLAIRFWAPYFDRVGVLRFRVANCLVWISSYVCVAISMVIIGYSEGTGLWIAIPILILGRVLKGVGHGGGIIAWSIGHLHYARKNQIDLYMSIHVALTGLRALTMPFLGLLANHWLGNGSFAIAILIATVAFLLFRKLARDDNRPGKPAETEARQHDTTNTNANVT